MYDANVKGAPKRGDSQDVGLAEAVVAILLTRLRVESGKRELQKRDKDRGSLELRRRAVW